MKLLDYAPRWEELAASHNPFAVVVMAHLKTLVTHHDAPERLRWKLNLIRSLYEGGYSKPDVLELFRIIDWLMALPEDLAHSFDEALARFEEEKQMPYVTSIEKHGIEKGALQMAREALLEILGARFGVVSPTATATVQASDNLARLKELLRRAATVSSSEEFERALVSRG